MSGYRHFTHICVCISCNFVVHVDTFCNILHNSENSEMTQIPDTLGTLEILLFFGNLLISLSPDIFKMW